MHKNRQLLPWYRIAWNLLWVIPLMATRCIFTAVVFFARGPSWATDAWRATE